jgi:hypothetical protein
LVRPPPEEIHAVCLGSFRGQIFRAAQLKDIGARRAG